MNVEELIINLKLLAQVEKGQKIITKDTYLNIETKHLIPECIRRWNRQEGRNETLRSINRIVNDSITSLPHEPRIQTYLKQSSQGIVNLKDTYVHCHQTCARLDTILDKIKLHTIEDKPEEDF